MLKFIPVFLTLPFDSGNEGVPVDSEDQAYTQKNSRKESPIGVYVLTMDDTGKVVTRQWKARDYEKHP